MTGPTPGAPRWLFETTEADLYRWQHVTLTDLLAFINAHAPHTRAPLPSVPWRLGTIGYEAAATLTAHDPAPTGIRRDPRAVLAAYAAVLRTQVREIRLTGKTRYAVTGRIGRPEGTKQEPRTTIYLDTDVWDEDLAEPSASAHEPRESPLGER